MKRSTIIKAALSIFMIIYMFVMLAWVAMERKNAPCRGFVIEISDTTHTDFVTPAAIKAELGDLLKDCVNRPISSINTDSIERVLARVDKIEEAVAVKGSDLKIHITVVPIKPVLRVFDPSGKSYYINKDGKRMEASLRYHVDVPIVVNEGYADFNPVSLLDMLTLLHNDSLYKNLMTAVNITPGGDIILVPSIRGLMINLGDTSDIDNKLQRLKAMYRDVLPVKGWTYYDTISVKWHGQVVASRRFKEVANNLPVEDLPDEEGDDIGTVMADSTAVKHSHKIKGN